MVRLLHIPDRLGDVVNIKFQSHNGAIAADIPKVRFINKKGFNPTMVRLLPLAEDDDDQDWEVSIPQWCDCCITIANGSSSGSHVSIPQWCDCCNCVFRVSSIRRKSFNPTMVRLLPTTPFLAVSPKSGFNPTMVRLLRVKYDAYRDGEWCFNPTMVRLLLLGRYQIPCTKTWFQSHNGAIAARRQQPATQRRHCFNPTMVRLLPLRWREIVSQDVGFNPTMVRLLPEAGW